MAYPTSGFIKIFPENVSIISAINDWSLNSDATPQPTRDVSTLDAYYDARVTNLAVAPCLRRATEYPPASGVYVPGINTYELSFSPSTRGIQFLESIPGAVVATHDLYSAEFPIGMVVNQVQVWWTGEQLFGPNRDRTIDSILFKYFGSTVHTYSPGAGLLSGSQASPSNAIISSLFRWSPLRAFKNFGFSVPITSVVSALTGTPRSINSECFITAVYNTEYINTTVALQNVGPGGEVTINASSQLNNFDQISINWYDTNAIPVDPLIPGITGGIIVPRSMILVQTATTLTLRIPYNLIPYGGKRLMIMGTDTTGTIFTGSVILGQVNIQLVDGSGIYTLVAGKTSDTYYDRSVSPVVTVDLKIPDPFGKTGFFNG